MLNIIGIIGGSSKVKEATLKLAYHVGQEIRQRNQIVLTGGHPQESRKTVKKYALLGSLSEKDDGHFGRAIGIIPRKKEVKVVLKQDNRWRAIFIHTCLSSHERNLLNGITPDVIIALSGGAGTLSEIAFAHLAGKDVIFLESLDNLRRVYISERQKLKEIVDKVRFRFRDIPIAQSDWSVIRQNLDTLLQNSPMIASTAEEALDKALSCSNDTYGEDTALARSYPGLPPCAPPRREVLEGLSYLKSTK